MAKFSSPENINIPVTCKTSKILADGKTENIEHQNENDGERNFRSLVEKQLSQKKAFTMNEDVKRGLISEYEQAHIRAVRKNNVDLYTHTERLRKEHDHFIRQVRQTGVTLVTNQAREYGFGDPKESDMWANFGQGAPECGPIPGGPPRNMALTLDEETLE